MFTVNTPFKFTLTAEARHAVGDAVAAAGQAAFREVVLAGQGFELACLQFRFRGTTLALSSQVLPSGDIEIAAGLGDASRPASLVTEAAYRRAMEAAIRKAEAERREDKRRLNGWR
jgi:hypothetical protein